jgi:predicted transcriptional regulator
MEEIVQLLKDVIIHDLDSCIDDHLQDSVETEETNKNAFEKRRHVNELLKTLDSIATHQRELELKERELQIRSNEMKLGIGSEINKLASTAANTATDVYRTKTGIQLTATAMDFEKGGNMFASQVSRTIPAMITKMVK